MVISKEALAKIKKIIDKNYNNLLLTLIGTKALSEEDLDILRQAGVEVKDDAKSILDLIYYNNVLNGIRNDSAPKNISEMKKQQTTVPIEESHSFALEHINESFVHATEKLKMDVKSRIEGLIRDNNMSFRSLILQNPGQIESVTQLIKESTLGGLKQRLRDFSGDVNRNWERIAITETANAVGLGSADRVISMNKNKSLEEVYVYRIPVNDSALCKFCRKFYLDDDQSPALYRMSTLLNNGTNYGKKTTDWSPVIQATHPNDRESGIIELRPGWKVGPGGKVEFIGEAAWSEYINKKLRS